MYSLSKSERLCSKTLIEELLTSKLSFVKYPFRIVFKEILQIGEFPVRIAISVSKKKFKRAVKRNRIKRLTRESFRLNKNDFYNNIPPGQTIDILFIYLDNNLPTYIKTEKAIKSALHKIPIMLSLSNNE
ncbi:MAG: ribonuclease P protein component [Odoribacter sp.]